MTTLEKIKAEIADEVSKHYEEWQYVARLMTAKDIRELAVIFEKYAEQELCDDAISRQAVLDGIEKLKQSPWATDKRNGFEYLITEALDIVAHLCVKREPSVRPQEPNSDIRLNREKDELNPDKDELEKTGQFAKWVATEIFDDMWDYNKDAFAEIACRKLEKLGIVKASGDVWELVVPEERSDKE